MSSLDVIKKAVGISRQYIGFPKIQELYPDGITIDGCYVFEMKRKEVVRDEKGKVVIDENTGEPLKQGIVEMQPCFTFAEDKTKYFYGKSGDAGNFFKGLLEENGTVEAANKSLKEKHIRATFAYTVTKSGRKYLKMYPLCAVDGETGEIEDF